MTANHSVVAAALCLFLNGTASASPQPQTIQVTSNSVTAYRAQPARKRGLIHGIGRIGKKLISRTEITPYGNGSGVTLESKNIGSILDVEFDADRHEFDLHINPFALGVSLIASFIEELMDSKSASSKD